jgi:tetratricopeptide (TPR) repeat protein
MNTSNNNDIFIRKGRGTNISRQAQRVYLCFDQANINELNILIDDLLSQDAGMDCVITWINNIYEFNKDDIQNELKETQVLIVWVTKEFLSSVNQNGIPTDFTMANELNIPILPIAQDEGLLPIFTDKVSKLHGIAMNDPEYRVKLKAQLENFLASESVKEQMNTKAFTAEVFLSYRKVDLDDAREFMKDLHNIDGLQGVSIWYDHFLTAGREFDVEIREAIEKSKAFILLVTPNITKMNNAGELNYVAREEVPFAIKKEKTIVPVEVKPRDTATFAAIFPTIGEPILKSALNTAFHEKLGDDAYIKSLGSERAYLLGIAYLRGYKVERDIERAIKLLEAATKTLGKSALDAAEQLAKIYEDGLGGTFSIDYYKALYWWQKASGISERINGKKHQITAGIYNKIGAVNNIINNYTKALEFHNKAIKILIRKYGKEHAEVGITYSNIGKVYIKLDKPLGISVLYDALKIYKKKYGENHPYTAGAYMDIGINHIENKSFLTLHSFEDSIYKLGGEKKVNKSAEYAFNNFVKALAIYKNIYGDNHYFTAMAHNYLGKVYTLMDKYFTASQSLNIALKTMNDIYGEEHLYSAFVYANLGLLHKQLDEYDKALYYFDKTYKIKKTHFSEDNIEIASMYNDIGAVYLRFGKYDKALEYLIKDVELLRKKYEENAENKKYEKEYLEANKYLYFILNLMSRGIWLSILGIVITGIIKLLKIIITLPLFLVKNIPKIVKVVSGLGHLKEKTKNNPNNIEGFGADIYSMFGFTDKKTAVYNMLKIIKDKYILIADLYFKNKDYKNSLQYCKLAMEIKRKTGDDLEFDDDENLLLNIKIGKLYMLLNDTNDAFEYCSKAFKLYNPYFRTFMIREKNKRKMRKKGSEEEVDVNANILNNIAEGFNILGQISFIQKKFLKSLECFQKVVEIHKLLLYGNFVEDTNNSENRINFRSYDDMITVYSNIGKTYKEMGEFDKALMNYNKALESFLYDKNGDNFMMNKITDEIIQLLDNDTEGKLSHLDTIMINIGSNAVCIKINKFDKTVNVDITMNNDKDYNLANFYAFAGNLYMKLNDQNKANELYDKALLSYNNFIKNNSEEDLEEQLKILKDKLAEEIKRYGNDNVDVAKTYYSIGLVYKSLNEPEKRLEYYKKGLEIRIKVQGEEHADTATQYNNVAVAYVSMGNSEKALEYNNKAISIRIKILGEDHIDTASSYANIAYVYKDIDKHQEALEYFEKALKIYRKNSLKNYKKQIELYNELIVLQNKIFGEEHEKTALTFFEVGAIYLKLKEHVKALESAKKALDIRKKIYGDENVDTASSYFSVGVVYYRLKEYQKALEYYNRALEINKELFAEDDQRVKEVMECIEAIKNSQNNP